MSGKQEVTGGFDLASFVGGSESNKITTPEPQKSSSKLKKQPLRVKKK